MTQVTSRLAADQNLAAEAGGIQLGIVEWFHFEDTPNVERTLTDLKTLGITHLRTGFSWADWHRPGGEAWFRWLLPRLGREVDLLPCFLYTPPSLGLLPKQSSPPRDVIEYGAWVAWMIELFGRHFEWVELWNEPNNLSEWDWTLDPGWILFGEMIKHAAYWAQQKGKKVALGGMSPIDPDWLDIMGGYGALAHVDAVGIHGFPGTWESAWIGWEQHIEQVRAMLDQHGSMAEIWITETGYSTWRHDEFEQVKAFLKVATTPARRVYWYGLNDLHPDRATVDGFHMDERDYHFGLRHADGTPKLLHRLWAEGGLDAMRQVTELAQPLQTVTSESGPASTSRPVLVTGGAGFVGTNLAHHLLQQGETVLILDNLDRSGVEQNLRWLRRQHGQRLQIQLADLRNPYAVRQAVQDARQVFHLAGQVAVTASIQQPLRDFEVNVRGTLNLLEALRRLAEPPPLLFTSTNKVYGSLSDIALQQNGRAYQPANPALRHGIGEDHPLDFYSPYGCSKGAADQYVLDYARIYDLPAVVFRMSCIYGPHQFGTEDQGWLAHLLISALENRPITLYGDGRQVRDVLYIDDLVEAMLLAANNIDLLSGEAYNIGGGPAHAVSLLQFLDLMADLLGCDPQLHYDHWRPGDQRYYVSDIRKFQKTTGWSPRLDVRQGVTRLYDWLCLTRGLEPAFHPFAEVS